MRFATVNDLTLHYRLEGADGGTALVFLNSLGSDLRIWDEVAQHFVGRYLVLRYDKRGHGLSSAPTGPYTIRDHTEDLAGLLERLGIAKAVLVGISVGGMIALDFAVHHPGKVAALVLCDTGAKIGTAEGWNERIAAVRRDGLERVAEGVVAGWVTSAFAREQPATTRGYTNMLARTPVAGYLGTCEALRGADLRGLETIEAKTLVLCGAEDRSTPPSLSQDLADALRHARLELIQNAAHLPCLEQPEAMAQKIESFLAENGYG